MENIGLCNVIFTFLHHLTTTFLPSIYGRCINMIDRMSPHLKNFEGFVLEVFSDNDRCVGKWLEVIDRKGTKPLERLLLA